MFVYDIRLHKCMNHFLYMFVDFLMSKYTSHMQKLLLIRATASATFGSIARQ